MPKKYNLSVKEQSSVQTSFDENLKKYYNYLVEYYGEEYAEHFKEMLESTNYVFADRNSLNEEEFNIKYINSPKFIEFVMQKFCEETGLNYSPDISPRTLVDFACFDPVEIAKMCSNPANVYNNGEYYELFAEIGFLFNKNNQFESFDSFLEYLSDEKNAIEFHKKVKIYAEKFSLSYAPILLLYNATNQARDDAVPKPDTENSDYDIKIFYPDLLKTVLSESNYFKTDTLDRLCEENPEYKKFELQNQAKDDFSDYEYLCQLFNIPTAILANMNEDDLNDYWGLGGCKRIAGVLKKLFYENYDECKDFDLVDFIKNPKYFKKLESFQKYYRTLLISYNEIYEDFAKNIKEKNRVQEKFDKFKTEDATRDLSSILSYLNGTARVTAFVTHGYPKCCILPTDCESVVIVHELHHVLSSHAGQKENSNLEEYDRYTEKMGFSLNYPNYSIGSGLNETMTEYLAQEQYKHMHAEGFEMGVPISFNCEYAYSVIVMTPMFEKYFDAFKKAYFGSSIKPLVDLIGYENFINLDKLCVNLIFIADKINLSHEEVENLWHDYMNGTIDLNNSKINESLLNWFKRAKELYAKIEEYIAQHTAQA